MVVVVLAAVLLAMASVTAFPDDGARLRTEGDRLAQLFMIAHDEAQVRGIPVIWEADSHRYRFVLRDGPRLVPIATDSTLRAREWSIEPMQVTRSGGTPIPAGDRSEIRVVFARASAQDPIAISLTHGERRVVVRGDGLGRFEVVQ
ncbi:type II secretion system minor pseudopilin GspH [soil metagenome]